MLLLLLLHLLLHRSHERSEMLPLRPSGFFLLPYGLFLRTQSGHDLPDMLRRHRITASRHGATRGPVLEAFLRTRSGQDLPDMLRRHRTTASRQGATRGPVRKAAWRWRHVRGPMRHGDSGMAVV